MDLEIEWEVLVPAVAIWLVISSFIVFVPKAVGLMEYPLSYKIMIPIVLLPISYFIVKRFNE